MGNRLTINKSTFDHDIHARREKLWEHGLACTLTYSKSDLRRLHERLNPENDLRSQLADMPDEELQLLCVLAGAGLVECLCRAHVLVSQAGGGDD